MMPISRQARNASLSLAVAFGTVVLVAACDTTGGFAPNEQRWGFVTLAALRNTAGEYRLAPQASFFRGVITSVPDARIRTDSCFVVGDYTPPNSGGFGNVSYLDAGASITTAIGTTTTTVPRVSTSSATTYSLGAGTTVPYSPGDSVVLTVPGAVGGFPGALLRGRSAEPFTIDPITASAVTIPLRWTAATDPNSALIVSLQYTPSGTGARTQEIRCAFTDDGLDSIPVRQHQAWSASSNVNRAVTVTRLRTSFVAVDGGAVELISTFQVPTPTP